MADTNRLASAVIAHAERQHEDSEWDIVVSGMHRYEVAEVITAAGARTPNQAIRAMQDYLDSLRVLAAA
jgi:hypothetical protein